MFENSKWICMPEFDDAEILHLNPEFGKDAAHIFRKVFSVDKINNNEKISICGLGFYTLKINGKKVGDELLTPPITTYDKTVYYQTYDIAEYLVVGENEITVTVGNGLYNDLVDTSWNFKSAAWRGPLKMICEMFLADQTIVSDSSWDAAISKTVFSSFREGETYDSLSPVVWYKAKVIFPPGAIIKPQECPPVRVREIFDGKKIFNNIYDFGFNITGNIEITVKGKRGGKVDIYYTERIRDDFTIDRENISMWVFSKRFAQDTYILSGEGEETWTSEFTYYGFRYAEILCKDAEIVSVRAKGYFTDLKDNGYFVTDNKRVNQLHEAVRRSTLTNFVHVPLDCPHREKNGWTGDAMLSCQQALFNFNMTDAYIKWLDDIVDCQRRDGGIPCVIPCGVWGFTWGNGPSWDVAFPEIVWQTYLYTGRKDILERYYEPLSKYTDYLLQSADNYIWYNGLGDWCAEDALNDISDMCNDTLLVTACAYYSICVFAKIAKVLGKTDTYNQMTEISKAARTAFIEKFQDINENSQTEMATVLYFGLTDKADEVLEKLNKRIMLDDYHIKCGIFGSKYVLEVLAQNGKFQDAWKILTREGYPGWFAMMDMCAGTLAEHWNASSSQNHHMFSHVDGFIWHYLVGLCPDEKQAGFNNIIIKPNIPNGMNSFSAWHNAPQGKLEVAYDNGKLAVTIPNGMNAILYWNGEKIPLNVGKNTF